MTSEERQSTEPSGRGAALIVGAGPGLGLALAKAFAGDGHPIALFGRDSGRVGALVDDLLVTGTVARGYEVDFADPARVGEAVIEACADLGAPEVLVYNAAMLRPDVPSALTDEQWVESLGVNVVSAAAAARAVIPRLRGGRGSVLFTGGGVALHPAAALTSLSVGKAALRALAHTLHEEQRDTDVHVSTVTITGALGDGGRFDHDHVASLYLELHRAPRQQWQAELVH